MYEYFDLDNNINNNLQNYADNLQNYFTNSNETNYQNAINSKNMLDNQSIELKDNVQNEIDTKKNKENITRDYYNKFNKNLEIINAQILGNKDISNKLATKEKVLDLGQERYRYTTHLYWFFLILNTALIIVLVYLLK